MNKSRPEVHGSFIDGRQGRLFCLAAVPSDRRCDLGVLFVPPFAEEMNRSRRMFALQARALAEAGMTAMRVDPFGTGDSGGDFAEADIDLWVDDLARGVAALAEQDCTQVALVALRFGALLADRLLETSALPIRAAIFWQPVVSGATCMTQLLRLRTASELTAGRGRVTVAELEARLADGESIDVGGYELSPTLYQQVRALELPASGSWGRGTQAVLCEVGNSAAAEPRPATARLEAQLAERGVPVRTSMVAGSSFWQTPEITTAEALIPLTVDALRQRHGDN